MGELKIITETGMPHSACGVECDWWPNEHWYGFHPKEKGKPHGQGEVDQSDRSSLINYYVTFDIESQLLKSAIESVVAEYQNKTYTLFVTDCVSFSADVARKCNLSVDTTNFTPYGLIDYLYIRNPAKVIKPKTHLLEHAIAKRIKHFTARKSDFW